MLIHTLATALARLGRAPLSTAAAILVLALGLVAFFGAVGVVEYWRLSDHAFARADRILAIGQRLSAEEGTLGFPMAAQPVAERVAAEFPELSAVARIGQPQPFQVTVDQRAATFLAAPADPGVLDIFDFQFLAGDARSALDQPGGAILTQSAAERIFGGEPALGRDFQTTDGTSLTVTGVIAPIPRPSHMGDDAQALLRFDYLYSWPEGVSFAGRPNWWISPNSWTYVLLPEEGLSRDAFAARLATLPDRFMPDDQKAVRTIWLEPMPLSQLRAEDASRRLFGSGARASDAVVLLFTLGAVVLGVACVNCANLAVARAAARIREAGMRKVLGERASWIALEHWVETGLLTLAAALLALALLWAVAPLLAAQTGIDLRVSLLERGALFGVFAAVVPLASLATSLFPTLLAARVAPAEALRAGRSKAGPRLLTQLLLALQFGTAGALVTVALVIVTQNGFIKERSLSDAESPVVALADRLAWSTTDAALRAAFEGQPGIAAVSRTGFMPWSGADDHSELQASPAAGAASIDAFANRVSYDFFSVFDQPLLAGRAFDPTRRDTPVNYENPPSSMPVVVDRSLARRLGFASPQAAVGAVIRNDRRVVEVYGRDPELEIIGVVADRHLQFSGGQAVGDIYYLAAPDTGMPVLRIEPGQVAAAMETIEAAKERLGLDQPLNWIFVDDRFKQGFRSYGAAQTALSILAVAALLISAVGALGIAGRLVQRRGREVAVRKVLDATVAEAARVLLKDFAGPVTIGILAAWPFAYLLAQAYLAAFMTRVDLTPAPFLVSLAAALAIAVAVVLGEVLKTAGAPPAEVLRTA